MSEEDSSDTFPSRAGDPLTEEEFSRLLQEDTNFSFVDGLGPDVFT